MNFHEDVGFSTESFGEWNNEVSQTYAAKLPESVRFMDLFCQFLDSSGSNSATGMVTFLEIQKVPSAAQKPSTPSMGETQENTM